MSVTLPMFIALATSAQDKYVPWRAKPSDEPLVLASLGQLYRDYCAWDKNLKAVVIAVGEDYDTRAASESVMRDFAKISKIRVLPVWRFKKIEYTEITEELRDPDTKLPAAQLTVSRIEYKKPDRAYVTAEYGRSGSFRLLMSQRFQRRNGKWQHLATECNGGNERTTKSGKSGSHTYKVTAAIKPFQLRKHLITKVIKEYDRRYVIDGRDAHGTDGNVPWEEFSAFEVMVDGKRWPIPKSLWADCYQPHPGSMGVRLTKDGTRLTIVMVGSDGAGSYEATWVCRKNGRHTRNVVGMD